MKPNRIVALAATLAMTVAANPAIADDTEAEIFAGEEAYWQYVNARDVDGFLSLWHERFRGWPCGAPTTSTNVNMRADISDWFAGFERDGASTTIENEGVVVDEDFAITYVAAATTTSDGKTSHIKLVHTWRRTADGWKIIGGMCGPLERY